MPTYEYECARCGHRFERYQSITAAPEKTCPECRGAVKRLLGAGGAVIVKRGGAAAPSCATGSCPMARDGTCPRG